MKYLYYQFMMSKFSISNNFFHRILGFFEVMWNNIRRKISLKQIKENVDKFRFHILKMGRYFRKVQSMTGDTNTLFFASSLQISFPWSRDISSTWKSIFAKRTIFIFKPTEDWYMNLCRDISYYNLQFSLLKKNFFWNRFIKKIVAHFFLKKF